MKIGIIGARLSGSYAGLLLSRLGHEVLLFDHTPHREKPCGGGITGKALSSVSWFQGLQLPHTEIRRMMLVARDGFCADVELRSPIYIYARSILDSSLRKSACEAGATFRAERALSFAKTPRGWCIQTSAGAHEVDFLVGADGAASSVRSAVARKYAAADLSLALGYYLPGRHHPATILAEFQESAFEGYLWSFPRIDHASVGILQWLPSANAALLRRRVVDFIDARYPGAGSERTFYAARIPCLSERRLRQQRVCGADWALLGDAAGFADAITAEGIHYALRSAELLAEAFYLDHPEAYENLWRGDFGADLFKAARWRDRFYSGTLLFQTFTRRVLQALQRSPTVARLTDDLIAGRTSYSALRSKVILRSPQILVEYLLGQVRKNESPSLQSRHEP